MLALHHGGASRSGAPLFVAARATRIGRVDAELPTGLAFLHLAPLSSLT